jgi:alpha-1,2-mannosyltransferase
VPDVRETARPRARRAVPAFVVLASLVASVVLHVRHPDALVTLLALPDMRELHVDFDTFWHSAVALTRGEDLYDTPAKLTNLNPPLLAVLFAPFALLDALPAYRVWVVLSLLAVVGCLLAAARELRLRPALTAGALVAVLASSPLHGTLVLGQIYPLLLVGLTAGWIAERRGRPVLAAVLYGVTVALKPSLAPLLLLPAVQRRWVPLRAGLASAAVASLVGVLVAGPSSGFAWLRIALAEPTPDTVDNASFPGLAVRFGLPSAVGLAVGVAVLAWTLHRLARADPREAAPFAVLAAGLLLAPIAWHNYLLLLLPGVLLLLARHRAATAAALLAVAVVPVSWNAEWPPEGVVPDVLRSLYFAILLAHWVVLLRAAERAPAAAQPVGEPSAR